MAVDGRYKYIRKAIADWLATSADLVSLTGHTAGAPRIHAMVYGDESPVQYPSCVFLIDEVHQLLPDCSKGPYEMMVSVECRATDESVLYDIAAAVEDLAAQDVSGDSVVEASFTGTNVKTESIIFLGSTDLPFGEATADGQQGGLVLRLGLRIIWRAT